MTCTYSLRSNSTTTAQQTGAARDTVDSPSSGTMRTERCTPPCQITLTRHSNASNMPPGKATRPTVSTHKNQTTEPRSNTPNQRTPPPFPTKLERNSYKRYVACSSTSPVASMVAYSPPLSELTSQQANPMEQTMVFCKQFLDYIASQDEAILTYTTSDMVLAIHSDASYVSKPKAAAMPAATCSWPVTKKSPKIMASSSTSCR